MACVALAAVGVLMVVVGIVWSRVTTPETFWTQDQAKEYSEAKAAATHPTYDAQASSEERAAQREAAQQRLNQISGEFDRARFAYDRAGPLLVQFGLAAAVAFGIGYWIAARRE
jgi:hypothetical protein